MSVRFFLVTMTASLILCSTLLLAQNPLPDGWYRMVDEEQCEGAPLRMMGGRCLEAAPFADNSMLREMRVITQEHGQVYVYLLYDVKGSDAILEATKDHVGKQIMYVMDDSILDVARVDAPIQSGALGLFCSSADTSLILPVFRASLDSKE